MIGAPAFAADLALKAPPPAPAPVWSWTGFYIGGNVGWIGINDASMSSTPNDAATTAAATTCIAVGSCLQNYGTTRGSGVIGGGQIGYNWQVQNYVVGLETDFQGTSARASTAVANTILAPFVGTESTRENYLGTVRGRLGVLATPSLLAYVTDGYAYASLNRNWTGGYASLLETWGGSSTSTVSGWTGGGGLEWAVGHGFTLGAEYLYVRLNGGNNFVTAATGTGCTGICQFAITGSSFNDNIVRVKLNYIFGGH